MANQHVFGSVVLAVVAGIVLAGCAASVPRLPVDAPKVSICDVLADPIAYSGRVLTLRGVVKTDPHSPLLLEDPACSRKAIDLEIGDVPEVAAERDRLWQLAFADFLGPFAGVEVEVVGKFTLHGGRPARTLAVHALDILEYAVEPRVRLTVVVEAYHDAAEFDHFVDGSYEQYARTRLRVVAPAERSGQMIVVEVAAPAAMPAPWTDVGRRLEIEVDPAHVGKEGMRLSTGAIHVVAE